MGKLVQDKTRKGKLLTFMDPGALCTSCHGRDKQSNKQLGQQAVGTTREAAETGPVNSWIAGPSFTCSGL